MLNDVISLVICVWKCLLTIKLTVRKIDSMFSIVILALTLKESYKISI